MIPVLLIQNGRLVKTVGFDDHRYIGDPINALRIFNEKKVDEVAVLDISTQRGHQVPDYDLIYRMAREAEMPFAFGGGINSLEKAQKIVSLGVEKVIVGTAILKDWNIIKEISKNLGSQSCVAMVNFKLRDSSDDKYVVVDPNPNQALDYCPLEFSQNAENAGAGEIIFNNVGEDGKMGGYNINFALSARSKLRVPITMLGGAGTLADIETLVSKVGLIGCAAGSLFIYKGKFKAVLINYPQPEQKNLLMKIS